MLGLMCFLASNSLAFVYDSVSVGDSVKMTDFLYADGYSGGIMSMKNVTNRSTWGTFCVDEDTNIFGGIEYTVSGFSNPNDFRTAYL